MREQRSERTLAAGRFALREDLGSGGYGSVHRAHDRTLGTDVAIKALHRMGADALLAFKNEFRRLSDLRHPHLVRLGELFEEDGLFFFSMELLGGQDLVSWVRGLGRQNVCDEARAREALLQICSGLSALHEAGLLHRDLKPENVRVTDDGRVVLLDFGLVSAFREDSASDASDQTLGTAAYMAPEQVRAEPAGPPADMYAMGIVLFELLTGELPFSGSAMKILLDKSQIDPPRPSSLRKGVAADLDELCASLMARDPAARPSARQVLARFGRAHERASIPPVSEGVFVGRAAELDSLRSVLERGLDEGPLFVLVEGESGVGKSALVHEALLGTTRAHPSVLVLRGRCHAREQVRFKALDGVIDELSSYLRTLSEHDRDALLPARAGLLTELFPVLGLVPGLEQRRGGVRLSRNVERHELFVVLVELLTRVSERRPLVIATDDLHWSDEDSFSLLRVLLDLLAPARVAFVATVRSIERLVGEVGHRIRELAGRREATRLVLAPLDDADARALSATLLSLDASDPRVAELAREAGGHPLFLAELAAQAGTSKLATEAPLDLDEVLRQRARRLGRDARSVLELLAVASAPVRTATLFAALRTDRLDDALAELRASHLVGTARAGELVCYHDRVREAVLEGLSERRRVELHHRLALAHEADADVDPAAVAEHWLAAEEGERARPWLERAAELSLSRSAFERAAELYACLVELDGTDTGTRHRHEVLLGEALAAAGRCGEAARVFRRALAQAGPGERLELSRLAAQRLLQAAEVDAGITAAREALELVGLSLANGTASALLRVGVARALVSMSRLERPPVVRETVTERERAQLDTLWRLAQPLGWADLLASSEVTARHVRLAARTGEKRHLALALSEEALFSGMQSPEAARPQALLARAASMLNDDAAPDVRAFHALARGQLEFFRWDLVDAERSLREAERIFHEECPAEQWLLTNARSVLLGTWLGRGEHQLLAKRAETWLSEAHERGDRFAITSIGVIGFGFVRPLMRDDPEGALQGIEAAMVPWRGTRFGIQHFGEALAVHATKLYMSGPAGHEFWESYWPSIERSFMIKLSFMREVVFVARARACFLAAAALPAGARGEWLARARVLMRKAGVSNTRMGLATAAQSEAELALLDGRLDDAREHALRAQKVYAESDHFIGRLLTYFLARLEGGDAGRQRADEVFAWLRAEGWTRPDRCVQMFVPAAAVWS